MSTVKDSTMRMKAMVRIRETMRRLNSAIGKPQKELTIEIKVNSIDCRK